MTIEEFKWQLAYRSNMLIQESLRQSDLALAEILAPLRKRKASHRRIQVKHRGHN